jgi:cell division protein FtsW (lipid II flippase)
MATDGPQHRSIEIAVALIVALFGAVVIFGSLKAGIGWGAEGPQSGFFPFYIGLLIVLSSLVNFKQAYDLETEPLFANWGQLGQVLAVVIPTTVYVLVLPFTGIYVASIVLIAGFMLWLGHYRWPIALATGIAVPVLIYFTFEKWFLVPLPKGPLEEWLNL